MAIAINGNTVTFEMKLKKDSLKAPEHKIKVEVDITGVSREILIKVCFSGSSARVRLQSKLRKKSESELARLAANGYKTTLKAIMEKDAQQDYTDALHALSREEFIKTIMRDFGCDKATAATLYEKKHANDTDDEE